MSKQPEHKCLASVGDGFMRGRCGRGAAYEHNGKFFCKTHHPPTLAAKAAERSAKWRAEWDAKRAADAKVAAERAEQKRRADCFPELLSALKALYIAAPVSTNCAEFHHSAGERHSFGDECKPRAAYLASLAAARAAIQLATAEATQG